MVKDALNVIIDAGLRASTNFAYGEFFRSDTAMSKGIVNVPPTYGRLSEVLVNLRKLANELEIIRSALSADNKAMVVTSGYRCIDLNKAVNGSPFSKHMKGLAADIYCRDYDDLVTACDFCFGWSKKVKCIPYDDKKFVHIQINDFTTL
ncbi:MAG: hypothetical protein IJ494_01765 [Bacteroides sp.]|nr:hypothetical protein [Bacteroides sp.]